MRRWMMLVGLATLLSFAPKAHAEGFTFGLEAGASVPMGDYGDALGIGPMGGVYGDYWMNPNLGLGADIVGNFHGMSSDLEDQLPPNSDFDFSFNVIQFGGHVKWKPAPTGFWASGGLGIYSGSAKVKSGGLEVTDSESKFGFNVGAGYDFPMGQMNLGIMAGFHNVGDAIEEFDNTGTPTGDTTAAQWFSVGATLTFLTAPR